MYELLQSDRRPCPMSSIQSREARVKREILKVSTRMEKAVTFTNWSFYSRSKARRYSWNSGTGWAPDPVVTLYI